MTDSDLFCRAFVERIIGNYQVIERARIGNGGRSLVYPPYSEFDD